jgi:hypothetical protein
MASAKKRRKSASGVAYGKLKVAWRIRRRHGATRASNEIARAEHHNRRKHRFLKKKSSAENMAA